MNDIASQDLRTHDKTPLLIDTDPGVDDALALLMAFDAPQFDVVALTIAAGNVGLTHTVANALKLCEVAGVDIPVHAGCDAPLLHPAPDASYVHSRDGFGDIDYTPATRERFVNPAYRAAAEAALAALQGPCNPLKDMPREDYAAWRQLEFTLNPRLMR